MSPAMPAMELASPEPIRSEHVTADFSSGEPSLDSWLRSHALAAATMRTANTFVVCRADKVAGYYSLANGAVAHSVTSAKVRRNTPDPIPATVLARLAVDTSEQRKGLGRELLIDAAKRTMAAAAAHSAARILIVHPLHDKAARFYDKFGFKPLKGDATALYITLDTLADGL